MSSVYDTFYSPTPSPHTMLNSHEAFFLHGLNILPGWASVTGYFVLSYRVSVACLRIHREFEFAVPTLLSLILVASYIDVLWLVRVTHLWERVRDVTSILGFSLVVSLWLACDFTYLLYIREVVKTTYTRTGSTKPQNRWWPLAAPPFLNLKRWCLYCIATLLTSSKK